MINWRKVPFIRILIPFLTGIVFASRDFDSFINAPLCLLIIFFVCWIALLRSPSFSQKWIAGAALQIFLFVFGAQAFYAYNSMDATHHQSLYQAGDWIVGQINDSPKIGQSIRFPLNVSAVGAQQQEWETASGRLMAYLPYSPEAGALQYGDWIAIKTRLRPIDAPKNPEAFDYQQYLARQRIYTQVRPKKDEWIKLDKKSSNWGNAFFLSLRNHCLNIFKQHLTTPNELAVTAALVLGDKSGIGEEVRNAYAETGALHVLAVSGLHVGFIAMGLGALLGFFHSYQKHWRMLKTLLILLGIWSFALITGASASVLRAASMFSFLIIGQSLQRHSSIYNTLAASAFCLLLFNPNLLLEVGFQLSYLAVIGIVFFYPRIYKAWGVDHVVGDFLWKMIAISLAAQLTTFPLSLYYFHQFPIYFWLSGMIVVPAAMLILPLGILLVLVELTIPFLALLVGKLLYFVVWGSTSLIFLLHQLPGGLIEGIWISGWTLGLLYLIIIPLMISLQSQKGRWLFPMAVTTLLLSFHLAHQGIQKRQQKKMTIYHLYKSSLVDLFDGRNSLSISSEGLEKRKISFAADNYRNASHIQHIDSIQFTTPAYRSSTCLLKDGVLQFYQKRIAFVDALPAVSNAPMAVDYILLRNNPKFRIEDLQNSYQFKTLLFDASNSSYRRKQWRAECLQYQLPYYDIGEEGAFTLDLNDL